MPKTPVATPLAGNVTASHSERSTRHIRTKESDAPDFELAARIKELIGKDSQVGFAKACGFSEGMLRKYLKGARPGKDNLVAMANYRNVSLQWLATGRGEKSEHRGLIPNTPGAGKTMNSLKYYQTVMEHSGEHPNGLINCSLLRLCLLACSQVHGEEFAKTLLVVQLEYACDFYNQLVRMANAKGPSTSLDDFCRLESSALADQLRFLVQMGWVRSFPLESSVAGSW